jgi:hypothetical protein
MKCLSVKQPWASLIIPDDRLYLVKTIRTTRPGLPDLPKDIENRTWQTPYRGPLLIHASLGYDSFGFLSPVPGGSVCRGDRRFWPDDYPRGAIIGRVELVDIVDQSTSRWHEGGQWGWVLECPHRFESPIPWKGALGLFDVSEDLLEGRTLIPCR